MSVRQLALFDRDAFRVRRSRRRRADNAKNHIGSKLLVVGGIIVDDQGRVLLLHRHSSDLSQWEIPGGKLERGEAPRETAVREVREELGIQVEIVDDLGWHEFRFRGVDIRYACYSMRLAGGTPAPQESKFDECRYFRWSQIYGMRPITSLNVAMLVDMFYSGRILTPKV